MYHYSIIFYIAMVCKFIKTIICWGYNLDSLNILENTDECQFCGEFVSKNGNVLDCSHSSHLKCYYKNRECSICKKDTVKNVYRSLF